jgi:site-specific recombinase XerD
MIVMNRTAAYALMTEYTQSDSLRKHLLAVEAAMKRCHRICTNLGLKGVSAYVLRHGYITQALERGVSIEVVAELVGNSPATIYKHYSHIAQRPGMLQAAARIAELS